MQTIHSFGDSKSGEFGLASARVGHLLVREISHRVNNELTSVIAFAVSIACRWTLMKSSRHSPKSPMSCIVMRERTGR
jgi:hypothetical protein